MSQHNPLRRSWQRKPPLMPEQESARHSRRTKRPKVWGIRYTWKPPWVGLRVYTIWYETERARDEAIAGLTRNGSVSRMDSVEAVRR